MILFIIGNGFDRNLKLPTDYRNDLRRILKKNDIDRFNIIDNLYFNNNGFLWSQFENKIGNIQEKAINDISESIDDDYQRFFNDNADPFPNPDPLSDQYIDTDNAIYGAETQKPEPSLGFNNLWDYITSGIKEMVSEANKTKMVSPPAFKNMDSSQIYLNFNYTNTLERIYHISPKKILHIHGSLERNDNLIYGNDKVSSVDTSSFDINFENPNLDELGSRDYPSNYNDFIDLITISESEQKNIKNKLSNDLNEENEQFKKEPKYNLLEKWLNQFEEKNITQIIVLGHSLGKVDKGYFELINQKYHSTTWCISYYNKQDQVFENAQSLSFYNKLNFKQFNTLLK